jgi:hypothetical protein
MSRRAGAVAAVVRRRMAKLKNCPRDLKVFHGLMKNRSDRAEKWIAGGDIAVATHESFEAFCNSYKRRVKKIIISLGLPRRDIRVVREDLNRIMMAVGYHELELTLRRSKKPRDSFTWSDKPRKFDHAPLTDEEQKIYNFAYKN